MTQSASMVDWERIKRLAGGPGGSYLFCSVAAALFDGHTKSVDDLSWPATVPGGGPEAWL